MPHLPLELERGRVCDLCLLEEPSRLDVGRHLWLPLALLLLVLRGLVPSCIHHGQVGLLLPRLLLRQLLRQRLPLNPKTHETQGRSAF
jgi:hypothetical protein